jgi:hypothetical protein
MKATLTSRLAAGTAWLSAKRYKVSPTLVKHHSTKTIKINCLCSSCREAGEVICVQLYQWTQCRSAKFSIATFGTIYFEVLVNWILNFGYRQVIADRTSSCCRTLAVLDSSNSGVTSNAVRVADVHSRTVLYPVSLYKSATSIWLRQTATTKETADRIRLQCQEENELYASPRLQ